MQGGDPPLHDVGAIETRMIGLLMLNPRKRTAEIVKLMLEVGS
jgi:hypothetical protein